MQNVYDTGYWIAVYDDDTYHIEGDIKFNEIKFNRLHHFTLWPNPNTDNVAICIIKPNDYRLIWRKQRYVDAYTNQYLGSDYLLGLEPDDNSKILEDIEKGLQDIFYSPMKKDPRGFRIWKMRDGTIRTAGSFSKKEEIRKLDNDCYIKYITCSILED